MPVTHNNVKEQVLDYFIANIEGGKWRVNEKIPSESQLTSELGVSRASVRQAVSQMVGIGVLNSIHGKGTFLLDDNVSEALNNNSKITAADCQDVEKVLEYRRIVEGGVCYEIASGHVDADLVRKLENAYRAMKNAANADDEDAFVDADIRFHKVLYRGINNVILEKSMDRIYTEMRKSHVVTKKLNGYENGLVYHGQILDAIKSGDAEKARDYMYDHLVTSANVLRTRVC